MGINIGHLLVTIELEQMSRYLDIAHTSLQDYQKAFVESVEKTVQQMGEEEKAEFYEFHSDDFIDVSEEFPRLLFLSFIVTWYSFVEQELIKLCDRLKLTDGLQENFDKGIRLARKLLLEARKYEIDNNHWQELTNISKLRNIIVHRGKRLPHSYKEPDDKKCTPITLDTGVTVYLHIDEAMYHYLTEHDMIEYTGLFSLAPSIEYCEYLVRLGKVIFSKLYSDLKPPSF